MDRATFLGLLNNAALLMAVGLLYDTVALRRKAERPSPQEAFTGVVLGAMAIAVMLNPWQLVPGLVFDTRSILLGLVGLFFGTVPTLVAVLMTAAFRVSEGGPGAVMGVGVILTSGAIGIAWRRLRGDDLEKISVWELYLFGLVVHVAMLIWTLSLPAGLTWPTLSRIGLPVMVLYPLGTTLLGKLLANRLGRKRVEAALQESEARYHSLFANNHAVMLLINPQTGQIVEANPAACAYYGYDREELLTKTISQINTLPPEQIQAEMARAEASQKNFFLFRHRLAGGEIRDVEVFSGPIAVAGQTLLYSIIHDVTERKIAEAALQASEEKFRLVVENAAEGMVVVQDDRIKYANSHALQLFAATSEEVAAAHYLDFTHPDDRELIQERYRRRAAGEEVSRRAVYRLVTPQGRPVWVEGHADVFRWEGRPATLVFLTDISERKSAEQALRERESKLSSILRVAPVGIGVAVNRVIVELNPRLTEMTGYAAEELIGQPARRLYPTEEEFEFVGREKYAQIAQSGTGTVETRFQRKDGQIINVLLSSSLLTPGDPSAGVTFTALDITERKRAEEELTAKTLILNTIFESAPYIMMLVDEAGRVVDINRAGQTFAEKDRDNLLGLLGGEVFRCLNSFDGLGCGRNPECVDCPVRTRVTRTFQTGQAIYNAEGRMTVIKDGQAIPLDLLISTSLLKTPEAERVLVTIADISERKRAEEALRVSEERLRKAQGVAHVGSWELNLPSRFLWASEEAFNIYGLPLTPDQVMSLEEARAVPLPEERPALDQALRRLLTQGAPYDLEFRIRRPADGAVRIVNSKAELVADPQGRPLKITGTIQDVTERKRAEETLRQSEEHFRSLFENMLNGFAYCQMLFDQGRPDDFIYLDVNQAFEDLTGLKNVVGKRVSEVIPGIREADPNLFEIYGRVALTGRPERFETYVQALDMWFSISVYSPRQEHFVAVFDVITERKRAEAALRQSEERLRLILETIPCGIQETDLEGRIVYANPTLERIYGYGPGELIGQHAGDLLSGSPSRRRWEELRSGILQDQPVPASLESQRRRKDGALVDINVQWDRRRDAQGRVIGVINAITDITARKQAEEERERLQAQLRQAQKIEALGTLAGGIAHDFNNILAAIIGYTELAQMTVQDWGHGLPELTQVLRAAERARNLVKQILTFSRKSESDLRPLNLNHSIRQALELLKQTLPKMISIETHLAEGLDLVKADANQMEQVLLNLASNASDAMPEGGRLVIETQSITLDDEYCQQHLEVQPGRYVLLQVSDTGSGMDEETREKIFDPFFTTKEVGKGTGLGLATVYGVVKAHDGHIYCYSELGAGTIFKIYLPAHQEEALPASLVESLSEELLQGRETILLVDDEDALRELGAKILAGVGYKILTAPTGEAALEIYREQKGRLDLVVLDLSMPGMGGHRCLKEILALDPQAKVVIASGYSANGRVKDSLASGALGFVAKPFRRIDLLLTVRDVLDGKRKIEIID